MKYYYFKSARTTNPATWYCYPWSDTILIVTNNSVSRTLKYNSSETWNFTQISETPAAQKLSATLIVKATSSKDSKTLLDEFMSFIQENSKGKTTEIAAKANLQSAVTYIPTESDYELELHSYNNNGGVEHDRFCFVRISAITNVEPVGGKDLKMTMTLTMESLWLEKSEYLTTWGTQGYGQDCASLGVTQEIENDGDIPTILGWEVFGFPAAIRVAEVAPLSINTEKQHVAVTVGSSYVSCSSTTTYHNYEYGDSGTGTGPVRICSGIYANKEYMVSMVGTHAEPQYKALPTNAYSLLTFSGSNAKSAIVIPARTKMTIRLTATYVGSGKITKTNAYATTFTGTGKLFIYKGYLTE